MAGDLQLSVPVDPLQAFTGISLLPRTIRASTPLPSDPNDLDSIHNFMKSTVSSIPERAEAITILDKGPELVDTKFGQFLDSLGIDKNDVALEGKEKPRREGLGGLVRKRARFSLKPATSQSSKDLVPSIDIDQLHDPVEFFAAIEKRENAIREIRILKGETSPHSTNYEPSRSRRCRRPGIPGYTRKSASYKHQYSCAIPEDEDLHMSSQEVREDALPSHGHDKLPPGTNSADSENEELDGEGSLIETENNVNEILDRLLDNKELDQEGTLHLLQEQLQLKPYDLGDLSIPHFHDTGRTKFKALAVRTRKSSSNIGNLVKRLSEGTPELKQGMRIRSPLNPISSPTPPRSPFASISLLKKRTLQPNTHGDPFSPSNVELSEPRNLYSGADIDKESHQVSGNEPNMSSNVRLNMEDDVCGLQNSYINVERAGSTVSPINKAIHQQVTDTNTSQHLSQIDMMERRSHINLHGTTKVSDQSRGQEDTERECVGLTVSPLDKDIHQQVTDENISPHRSQINIMERHSHTNLHGTTNVPDLSGGQEDTERDFSSILTDNVGDGLIVSPPAGETLQNNEDKAKYSSCLDECRVDQNLEEMHSKEAFPAHQVSKVQESVNMDTLKENGLLTNEVTVTVTEVATEDIHVDMSSTIAEKCHLEKQHCEIKKPRGRRREYNAHPLRPSIAAAGSYFESGVRRSKRIKTRPLEYWKGERLLFGRVDDSIKLIGMKYFSPAKDGGNLKVKSYVADRYKEILELAAAH